MAVLPLLRLIRRGVHYEPSKSTMHSLRIKHLSSSLVDSGRMQGYPDKLFLLPIHTQLPATKPLLSNFQLQHDQKTQKFTSMKRVEDDTTFRTVLSKFSEDIRKVHKRKITWPKEDHFKHADPARLFRELILMPIAELFNQLRMEFVPNNIEVKIHNSRHNNIPLFEFFSVDFPRFDEPSLHPPVVIISVRRYTLKRHSPYLHNILNLLKDYLCQIGDNSIPPFFVADLLEEGWKINPMAKILLTDLQSLFVIHPPDENNGVLKYESRQISNRLDVLRICIAAYLYDTFTEFSYLRLPLEPDYMDDVNPHGALNDPSLPFVPDDVVFRTSHRNSDFDYYPLINDRERALQFFRWRSNIKEAVKLKHVSSGVSLRGETNGFRKMHCIYNPMYAAEDLPEDTMNYIESSKRPTLCSEVVSSFSASDSFRIELLEDFTRISSEEAPELKICRTYKCRITEIDGHPVHIPQPLCVKIYDDRFYPMDGLLESPPHISWWFLSFTTAEDNIRREVSAYENMKHAQGSVIPHFYGAHKFTLPDGHELFGIIIEYIPGKSLTGGGALALPNENQVQLVRSVRHAVRVLQYSDVSQLDWHGGQILCITDSTTTHCVLIDFASALQTLDPLFDPGKDDYMKCLIILLDPKHGLDKDLVWTHYGRRETWDMKENGVRYNGEFHCREGPDPFAFIYELPN